MARQAAGTQAPEPADWVRPLADARLSDRADLGGKAAVLGELSSKGMPVLPGIAISCGAYETVIRGPEIAPLADEFWGSEDAARRQRASADIARQMAASSLPEALGRTVLPMLRELGVESDLIVRSSATAEDGRSTSFAGQFVSVRSGNEAAAIGGAIATVWSSATSSHVAQYLSHIDSSGEGGTIGMGVLIQPYERFEVAGVFFSQHPTVQLRDWALVEFLDGPPDRIVNGEVTPHRIRLRISDGTILWEHRAESDADLTGDSARDLATYGAEAAELLSADVDMEWGRRGGEVIVLQARPATMSPWG